MTTTRDVHQETVTLLSDAVTEITKRAVEPTLEPFGAELRSTVAAFDVRLRTLDDLLGDDRADRQRLSRVVSELPAKVADGTDQLWQRVDQAVTELGELRSLADEIKLGIGRLRWLVLALAITLGALAAAVLTLSLRQ